MKPDQDTSSPSSPAENGKADLRWLDPEIVHLASFPQWNPMPVVELDELGAVTYMNEAASAVLRETVVRRTCIGCFPPTLGR